MPIGIDISPLGLFLTKEDKTVQTDAHYGIVGVTSRWHEPIIWTDPYAIRVTSGQTYLSLSQLWKDFLQDYKSRTTLQTMEEKDSANVHTIELIVDALQANMSKHSADFSVLAIDNTISEFHQTVLLKQLGKVGFGRRELLWRPIALALSHLMLHHDYKEGDSILVVDTDAYQPELTLLELKEYRGQIVPLRKLPKERQESQGDVWNGYSSANMIRQFIEDLSSGDQGLFAQLMFGPFSGNFLNYLDSGKRTDVWIRNGLNHSRLGLNPKMRENFGQTSIAGKGFDDLRSKVERKVNDLDPTLVLWHGLSARLNLKSLDTEHLVMPAESISVGAAEYGRRRVAGEPTYLDTLSGLKILSLEKKTGSHKFFTVIPAGEVEGGRKVTTPETITKFKLEEGTKEFTAILKNPTTDTYKRLVTKLPTIEYQGENIPLAMNAEMQPAQGHATITIAGVGEQLELFGPQQFLELDWESGEDVKIEDIIVYKYNGPEVYPVRGRIADDNECLAAAQKFVEENLFMGSKVPFRGSRVSYARVHEPWGWKDPTGKLLKEPTRAMFGAFKENDPKVQSIADGVANQIYETVIDNSAKFKYLNYMFRYAPEKFRNELRSLFQEDSPKLNWNSIYAVGRTFHRLEDFELFVDFLLKHSRENGYPEYPSEVYTKSYFWAYFRALCYYEDPVGLPTEKAEQVLKTVYQYSVERSNTNWGLRPFEKSRRDVENLIKFILSAILFSIRFRKKQPDFLSKGTKIHEEMVEVVNEMTLRIDYPKTMFKTTQPDKLNDYVLRFLNDEQTEKDIGVLKGLIVE